MSSVLEHDWEDIQQLISEDFETESIGSEVLISPSAASINTNQTPDTVTTSMAHEPKKKTAKTKSKSSRVSTALTEDNILWHIVDQEHGCELSNLREKILSDLEHSKDIKFPQSQGMEKKLKNGAHDRSRPFSKQLVELWTEEQILELCSSSEKPLTRQYYQDPDRFRENLGS